MKKVKFVIRNYEEIKLLCGVDRPEHICGEYYSVTKETWEVLYRNFPYNVRGSYPI